MWSLSSSQAPWIIFTKYRYVPVSLLVMDWEGTLSEKESAEYRIIFSFLLVSFYLIVFSCLSFFSPLLHPKAVVLNADEVINGPTPGNHFWVISSATELPKVNCFQPGNLGAWLFGSLWKFKEVVGFSWAQVFQLDLKAFFWPEGWDTNSEEKKLQHIHMHNLMEHSLCCSSILLHLALFLKLFLYVNMTQNFTAR